MYCPKCFNPGLKAQTSGVINVIVNGKQMDAGRFLYNLASIKKDQLVRDFCDKLDEFFSWYSSFNHREPISTIELTSADFACQNGCSLGGQRFSVIDILISSNVIEEKMKELAQKHRLDIKLKKLAA